MSAPRVAIGPKSVGFAEDVVRSGGAVPVRADEHAEALVWLSASDMEGLKEVLENQPGIRWVQLPSASSSGCASGAVPAYNRDQRAPSSVRQSPRWASAHP